MIEFNSVQALITQRLEETLSKFDKDIDIVSMQEELGSEHIKIIADDVNTERLSRELYDIKCTFGIYYYRKDEAKDMVIRGVMRNIFNYAFSKDISADDIYIAIESMQTDWQEEYVTGTLKITYFDTMTEEENAEFLETLILNTGGNYDTIN